jgi:glucose-6-phosphate dehydrogenase assembly protein OpcA
MATTTTYKSPVQVKPDANTLTTLYTVPSSTQSIFSAINICNLSSTSASVRIAFRPNGESINDKHYILYDVTISGNDTYMINQGMSMDSLDVLSVYASTASVSFTGFYAEVTQ